MQPHSRDSASKSEDFLEVVGLQDAVALPLSISPYIRVQRVVESRSKRAPMKQHIASTQTEGKCAGDMSCRRGTDSLVFLYDGVAVTPARTLRIRVLRADWDNQLT